MFVEVQVTINESKAAVWAAITDIANAAETIRGIEKIEVLETPPSGLVGLKWRETRMLFGNERKIMDLSSYPPRVFQRTVSSQD